MQRLRMLSLWAGIGCLSATVTHGADLRTTACDRPVCRTVAIMPDAVVEEGIYADEGVPMDLGNGYDRCNGACGGACGGSRCLSSCSPCCVQFNDSYVGVDFLLGWRHSIRTPPLVTTSPAGTAQAVAGVRPGATVVYPPEPFGEDARPGARVTIGTWFDPAHCWGIEGRAFMLGDERTNFDLASTGNPILARPFFDAATNAEASRLIAFPGIVNPGSVSVTTESEIMGGDVFLRRMICRRGCDEFGMLVGYQFARIDESLLIADLSTDIDPANLILDGTTLQLSDRFATQNEYHAATIGGTMSLSRGPVRWDLLGKLGFGNMQQRVAIAGSSTVTVPGQAAVVTDGGLLALGTNLGSFDQEKFCVSPEISVKCVYQVTPCIDVSAGYNFLYFTSVAQPGQQIDIDLRVPTNRFEIREDEFWVHAFQFGTTIVF